MLPAAGSGGPGNPLKQFRGGPEIVLEGFQGHLPGDTGNLPKRFTRGPVIASEGFQGPRPGNPGTPLNKPSKSGLAAPEAFGGRLWPISLSSVEDALYGPGEYTPPPVRPGSGRGPGVDFCVVFLSWGGPRRGAAAGVAVLAEKNQLKIDPRAPGRTPAGPVVVYILRARSNPRRPLQ